MWSEINWPTCAQVQSKMKHGNESNDFFEQK